MKLLFICTHNRCRSILAEAITNHIAGDRITAVSAGSAPEGLVHPMSLTFLSEKNIPTEDLNSQSWNEFEDFQPDAILTMCDEASQEACPVWFDDSVQVHWGLKDPSKNDRGEQQQRESFRTTMDIIERRIRRLLENDITQLSGLALRKKLSDIATQIH